MKTSTFLWVGGAAVVGYIALRGRAAAAPGPAGIKPNMPPPIFSPEAASNIVARLKMLLAIPPPPANALPDAEIRKQAASWWATAPHTVAAMAAYLRALHRAYWPLVATELAARGVSAKTILDAAMAAAGLVQR